MPSIQDNIEAMAGLVAKVKREHKLSEQTILRIVDMNFALAQTGQQASFGGDEEIVFPEGIPPDLFPVPETDEPAEPDTLATAEHRQEPLN